MPCIVAAGSASVKYYLHTVLDRLERPGLSGLGQDRHVMVLKNSEIPAHLAKRKEGSCLTTYPRHSGGSNFPGCLDSATPCQASSKTLVFCDLAGTSLAVTGEERYTNFISCILFRELHYPYSLLFPAQIAVCLSGCMC